jgi:hypothetical protein
LKIEDVSCGGELDRSSAADLFVVLAGSNFGVLSPCIMKLASSLNWKNHCQFLNNDLYPHFEKEGMLTIRRR